jgi:intracellular septation protein A
MHLITLGLLVVFGGITLAVRDPAFLMWKVSVLYGFQTRHQHLQHSRTNHGINR